MSLIPKFSSKLIQAAQLVEFPRNVAEFIQFVEENDNSDKAQGLAPFMVEHIDQFFHFLTEYAPRLTNLKGPSNRDLPWLLCPSLYWGENGMTFPVEFAEAFNLDQAIDAYFGMCYQTNREGTIWENGTKAILIEKVKRGATLPRLFSEYDVDLGVALPDSLFDLYGRDAVGAWYRGLTPQEVQSLEHSQANFLMEELKELFG
jgi:hypothetical protein